MFRAFYVVVLFLFIPLSTYGETVKFRFEATTPSGDVVDSVRVGDEFVVNAYAALVTSQDPADVKIGVFAAYLDIDFDPSLAQPSAADITYGDAFMFGRHADLSTPGTINNAGAFGGFDAPTELENLVFSLPMEANGIGQLALTGAGASESPDYDVLIYGLNDPLPASEIDFGSLSLEIAEVPEPSSGLLLLSAVVGLFRIRSKSRRCR